MNDNMILEDKESPSFETQSQDHKGILSGASSETDKTGNSITEERKKERERRRQDRKSRRTQARTQPETKVSASLMDIYCDSRGVHRALEIISSEYKDSKEKLEAKRVQTGDSHTEKALLNRRIHNVEKNIEKISMAMDESEILCNLGNYIMHLHCDNHKIKMQNSRLDDENNWLKEELQEYESRKKLVDHELALTNKEKETSENQYYQQVFGIGQTSSAAALHRPQEATAKGLGIDIKIPPQLHHISNLVEQFLSNNKVEVALPLCLNHVSKIKSNQGKNHLEYAIALCLLAKVYMAKKCMKEAIKCFSEALPIIYTDKQSVASIFNLISQSYYLMGNRIEAEKNAMKALVMLEKEKGKDSPDVTTQLCNLGLLYSENGKFGEAETFLAKGKRNLQSNIRGEDGMLVKLCIRLAAIRICAGRVKEAEKDVKDLIDNLYTAHMGRVSELTPSFWMIVENPRYQKIEKLYQQVGVLKNPDILDSIKVLQYFYKKKGDSVIADLIDEYLQKPEIKRSVLITGTESGQSTYFKTLTRDSVLARMLSEYVEGDKKPLSKTRSS